MYKFFRLPKVKYLPTPLKCTIWFVKKNSSNWKFEIRNWYIIIKIVLITWTLQSTFIATQRCYIRFDEVCPKSFWFSCKRLCIFLQTGRKRKPRNTGRNSCWRNWWKLSTSETRWFSIWTHRRERTYLIPASQGSTVFVHCMGTDFFLPQITCLQGSA